MHNNSLLQAVSTRFVENLWVPDIYIYHMNKINRVLTDYKGGDGGRGCYYILLALL